MINLFITLTEHTMQTNFEHFKPHFEQYQITPMDHGIRINGVADIHRYTPYVHDLVNNDRKNFKSYREAVEYALLVVQNNPAKEIYRKTEKNRMSYQEFKYGKKWKPTLDHPETYHWNNQLHEKSDDHLYFITNGDGLKIGRSKNPSKRLKELQTGSASKLEILCVIKNKGFLEKTLHRCFNDIKLHGEWFSNAVRIAKFINLTQNWHLS